MVLSRPQLLTGGHDLSQFDCGKPALDDWLRARALSNQQNGFTVVLVVCDDNRVVGYYGLAPTTVEPRALPRRARTGQPPNPIPCLLLGQLAIDRAYAGQGVGSGLLAHALERAVLAARLTGGRALIVRAVDQEAAAFWRRRGFLPTAGDAFLLFRTLADIAASLQAAGRTVR